MFIRFNLFPRSVLYSVLTVILFGAGLWQLASSGVIARVSASEPGGQSKVQPSTQTKAQTDLVAASVALKQATAAYQANPTAQNAAALASARTGYDEATAARVVEINNRLAQLLPKTSFLKSYEKKPEKSISVPAEAVALLSELRSYDPFATVQGFGNQLTGTKSITQSSSQEITQGSSVACSDGIGHADTSYWRAFNLSSFGIVHQFDVSSVQIGIEKAVAVSGSQPLIVRLYQTTSGAFPSGTRSLLSSSRFNVSNEQGTIIKVPVTASVPAGSELVVEVFTPNGQVDGNLLFIGSNSSPEGGPSYISAASGGIAVPTPASALELTSSFVLNVLGTEGIKGGSTIVAAGATLVSESCVPANGALDPNETVTVSLCVQNTGGLNTTDLIGTLLATGGVTNIQPPNPQDYGVVVAGGPAVCRNFTFTVNGTCGGTVTATLQLQDGATNLGTVTYTFNLGVLNTALSENFDGVVAPALPAGWVSTTTAGAANCTPTGTCALTSQWTTVTTTSDTAPNSAFHNDPSCVTDNTLDTPSISITSASAQVTFRNNFILEDTFDGAVLEVSSPNINGGVFTDITAAAVGGSFVSGGYTDTISVNFLSPIAGRQAWSGNSGGFITTTANLGPNVAGQIIKLRFRFASDCSVSATGWNIDTVKITDGVTCCISATPCVLTCPANVTQSNDPNQCGAVVTYPAPTSTGTCGTITCSPVSGSFFPVGTTTVTCQATGTTCNFTVTVNDTQPPSITCSANVTAVTDQNACPAPACQVVNFTTTASDNCPGVVVVCNPPSGSCFPIGVTSVTCTATDASGNTATCSFTLSVFDTVLQDDSNPSIILLWNSITGQYRFCCNGITFTGVGKSIRQGCVYTLDHTNAIDRRVLGRVDKSVHSGTASLQAPPGTIRCVITDRNTLNDTNVTSCQ